MSRRPADLTAIVGSRALVVIRHFERVITVATTTSNAINRTLIKRGRTRKVRGCAYEERKWSEVTEIGKIWCQRVLGRCGGSVLYAEIWLASRLAEDSKFEEY